MRKLHRCDHHRCFNGRVFLLAEIKTGGGFIICCETLPSTNGCPAFSIRFRGDDQGPGSYMQTVLQGRERLKARRIRAKFNGFRDYNDETVSPSRPLLFFLGRRPDYRHRRRRRCDPHNGKTWLENSVADGDPKRKG